MVIFSIVSLEKIYKSPMPDASIRASPSRRTWRSCGAPVDDCLRVNRWGPRNSNFPMVYGTYNELVNGIINHLITGIISNFWFLLVIYIELVFMKFSWAESKHL